MQNLAFEVDELAIAGLVHVSAGVADPAIALIDLPVGSLYLRSNGELWQKIGAMANEWAKVTAGSGSTTYDRLADFVEGPSGVSYSYMGKAVHGSSLSAPVWVITRFTIASAGTIASAVATGVAWSGRYTATYIGN